MKAEKQSLFDWKLFFILLGACIFGIIAIIPYTLTHQLDLLKEYPIPLHILLPIQILQNVFIFAIIIFVGLYLAKKVGLGAPILEGWLEGRGIKSYLKSIWGISIALGVLTGSLIIGFDAIFTFIEPINITQVTPPIWQSFLACFYGGINEEVIARLFLMTLLVWIFYKIKRTEEGKPTNQGVLLAIVVTAILFGVGHLPFAATLAPVTPLIIIRVIFLNAIGGITFGWLYWKKGLESAMISHFFVDIVLHVFLPLLLILF
ncbi:MAG: CPBP family intramembrane glutamic endopeptidase [Candidatus Thermoplasmatota archaeon]